MRADADGKPGGNLPGFFYNYFRQSGAVTIAAMDDAELWRALEEAQAAVTEAPRRRRELVMLARKQGWTKYKIGKALNAAGPTVDAIIDTAEREAAKAGD